MTFPIQLTIIGGHPDLLGGTRSALLLAHLCHQQTAWFWLGHIRAYHIRNSIGPNTNPWDTPDVTGVESELSPSTTTF